MVNSLAELGKVLKGTTLEGRPLLELDVLDTGARAYAVEISGAEVEEAWRVARGLLDETGRWPVAAGSWESRGRSWEDDIRRADFFSRFYFEEAPGPGDVSPQGIVAAADSVDPSTLLDRLAEQAAEHEDLDLEIEVALQETEARCGSAPTRAEVDEARVEGRPISAVHDLERWLLEWEQDRGGCGSAEDARQPWFEMDPAALLFLPTPNGWDAVAYLHWYAAEGRPVESYVALGRLWEQRFGAELVAHWGTMLQCLVHRPPRTLDEAWEIARQHELVAPSTLALPGLRLRHYARGLVGHERWFLHERP